MKLMGTKNLLIVALLMNALMFVLAGCSGGSASNGNASSEAQSQTTASTDNGSNANNESAAFKASSESASITVSNTAQSGSAKTKSGRKKAKTMNVRVNGKSFIATFSDTKAANEFRDLLPLTVDATELNGNEKYGELDRSLSTDGESVVSSIKAGDIFLYGGNDVVLFYQSHSNSSWSYVPIAHIDDTDGLADAVGSGDVSITYEEA